MLKVNYIKRIDVEGRELVVRLTPSAIISEEIDIVYTMSANYAVENYGLFSKFNVTLNNVKLQFAQSAADYAIARFRHWLKKFEDFKKEEETLFSLDFAKEE